MVDDRLVTVQIWDTAGQVLSASFVERLFLVVFSDMFFFSNSMMCFFFFFVNSCIRGAHDGLSSA